jgi:hypothetical protein
MPFLNPDVLHLRSVLLRVVIPVGGALFVGCEATGPRTPASVSLSVASMPRGSAPSLKITNVEFVLAEAEMAQAATCSTGSATGDGCGALQRGPVLINLPFSAARPTRVLEAPVSAGTYTRLQAKLHATGSDAAFRAAHPDWPAGMSVRVAGVYTEPSGVAHDFTFTSAASADLRIPFAQPVRVAASRRHVTMVVDVARWFGGGRGSVIDPRDAANAAAIDANIRNSFQAFEDDDQDGVEDDQNEVDDDQNEVDDDQNEVDDDQNEVDDDQNEVDDDTTPGDDAEDPDPAARSSR